MSTLKNKTEVYKSLDGITVVSNGTVYNLSDSLSLTERIACMVYWGVSEGSIYFITKEKKKDVNNAMEMYKGLNGSRYLFSFLPKNLISYSEISARYQEFIAFITDSLLDAKELANRLDRSEDDVWDLLVFLGLKENRKEVVSKKVIDGKKTVETIKYDFSVKQINKIFEISKLFNLNFTYDTCREFCNNIDKVNLDIYNSNFKFAVKCILGFFKYSKPFYPLEDKILSEFYVELGDSVVDLLTLLVSDYEEHTIEDYQNRIIELGLKTAHPNKSFLLTLENKNYLDFLSSKMTILSTKYIPWMDSFDLSYYCNLWGYKAKYTQKTKEEDYVSDLVSYISRVKKFKEFIYHNTMWTSERQSYLEKNFKLRGFSVLNNPILKGISFDECKERVKQFKLKQNYTVDEVKNMELIYKKRGIDGLITAFPYRSIDALRYKIKEQGWDVANTTSEEIESKVSILFEKRKEQYYKEIELDIYEKAKKDVLNTITEKYKSDIYNEVVSEVVKEFQNKLDSTLDDTFLTILKKEISQLLTNCTLKELAFESPLKITEYVIEKLKKRISKINI